MSTRVEKRAIEMQEVVQEPSRYWSHIVIGDDERVTLPGGKGWAYISPAACGSITIEAGIFEMSPHMGSGNTELHSHSNEEFSYILSGKGWIAMEDERHHFQAGDFVYIPSFARHGWMNAGDEPVRVLYYRPVKPEPASGERPLDIRRFKIVSRGE